MNRLATGQPPPERFASRGHLFGVFEHAFLPEELIEVAT
jgi:hypothetical protein